MPLFVIKPTDTNDDERLPDPEGAKALGYAAGLRWYKADAVPPEGRAPTRSEFAIASIDLPAIKNLKSSARRKIQAEVGDVYEILADHSKQIEALTVMVCRLSAEYLGGTAMTEEERQKYLIRVESVLGAISAGHLTLRGDLEGADDMLQKTLERTDRVNRIVGDEYLPLLRELIS